MEELTCHFFFDICSRFVRNEFLFNPPFPNVGLEGRLEGGKVGQGKMGRFEKVDDGFLLVSNT